MCYETVAIFHKKNPTSKNPLLKGFCKLKSEAAWVQVPPNHFKFYILPVIYQDGRPALPMGHAQVATNYHHMLVNTIQVKPLGNFIYH